MAAVSLHARGDGGRRLIRWSVLPLLAYVAYLARTPGDRDQVDLVNNVVQLAVPLAVAAPLAARAALRASGRTRAAWWLLTAACTSWGLGQVVWTWMEDVQHVSPYPSLADVGFLAAVPLLLAGVLCYPAAELLALGRLRAVLDGGLVAASLLFVCFGTLLRDAEPGGGATLASWLLAVAYPVSDVITASIVVAVLTRRTDRWSGPLPLIAAGVVAIAIADAAFAVAAASDSQLSVSPTDVGWPIGFLLIAVASLRPADGSGPARPVAGSAPRARLLFPYVAIVPALAVVAHRIVSQEPISVFLGSLAGVAVLLVLGRQMLVLLENGRLTDGMRSTVEVLRQREEELVHQAFHDPLTGLANRALLRDRLEHALAGREADPVSLLFVDLDDFKTVNDSLGHDAGDRLLELVAERLRACVRPEDTVARLGGDEFAVLLGRTGVPGAPARLAERVLAGLESPFRIAGRDLRVQASLGLVPASRPGDTAEDVVQDADLAMYAAKAAGKGRCAQFEPSLRSQAVDRLELVTDMRLAVSAGQLVLHYQPIVDLGTFEIIGQEALVRWQHPRRGLLHPGEFIGLAEETDAITGIGLWVLEEACRSAVLWAPVDGAGAPVVGVNVSARQLADPAIVATVAAVIDRTGIDPQRLELEITESVLLTDDVLAHRLGQLRALGVRLAIDDFGTGYSSLSYLTRLPVDVVKIDRSFVDRLPGTGDQHVLVRSVIQLADSLGLRAVGEGIETAEQLAVLQDLGCAAGQGYLLGAPAPVPLRALPPSLVPAWSR